MRQGKSIDKLHILIAPLDWGLGHATRCIPVIRELLKQNCEVIIAAEGPVKALLVAEFPQLSFVSLPGYHIQYTSGRWKMLLKIAAQIPKMLNAIRGEHQWLQSFLGQHQVDAVVSDNRYGFYNEKVYSVFMTHQLMIKSPLGKWSELWLQRINYSFISHFQECWVPDTAGKENFAGALSHPVKQPAIPVTYLGPLSRFCFQPKEPLEKHVLILLSGPEPQRTLFEQTLLHQLNDYPKPVLFVRGLPHASHTPITASHITIKNHLRATELEKAMAEASYVIARCGYSTVMDVMALNKKSILIPTPGQTEQEYLAKHLMQYQYALCISQERFRLNEAIPMAERFNYKSFPICNANNLELTIQKLLNKIIAFNRDKA